MLISQLLNAKVAVMKYRSWLTNKSFLDSFLNYDQCLPSPERAKHSSTGQRPVL